MRFATITSKYDGKCKRCGKRFTAGTRIRYGGRGRTYHLTRDCAAGQSRQSEAAQVVRAQAVEAAEVERAERGRVESATGRWAQIELPDLMMGGGES